MKKIICAIALTVMIVVSSIQTTSAQDSWIHGKTGIYSVGIGGTQLIYLSNYYSSNGDIGLSLNVSGEYKAWKWIGAGFQTGLDFTWAYYHYNYGFGGSGTVSGGPVSIAIPIGGKVNFHLMDAFGVGIADKLDVYAGINLGFGPSIYTGNTEFGGNRVYAIMHVGPQVGVRYWFNDNVAIFTEFGYGATFANAGVTF